MDSRAHEAGSIRSLKAVGAVATPIREGCVSAVVSLIVTTIFWPVGQRYGMINISISLLMLLIYSLHAYKNGYDRRDGDIDGI